MFSTAAIPLSTDHKPDRSDERQRIEDAGGFVIWAGKFQSLQSYLYAQTMPMPNCGVCSCIGKVLRWLSFKSTNFIMPFKSPKLWLEYVVVNFHTLTYNSLDQYCRWRDAKFN